MKGTWQTDSPSPGPHLAILAIIAAAVLGSGAAAAAATAVVIAVIAFGALLALVVIGLAVLVVYRIRRERQAAPPVLLRQLDAGTPRELGQSGPRELHQHTHYHWHGAEAPAEILRRVSGRSSERKRSCDWRTGCSGGSVPSAAGSGSTGRAARTDKATRGGEP